VLISREGNIMAGIEPAYTVLRQSRREASDHPGEILRSW
jgi:hypothetical protein